jgi:hypothetical protein
MRSDISAALAAVGAIDEDAGRTASGTHLTEGDFHGSHGPSERGRRTFASRPEGDGF